MGTDGNQIVHSYWQNEWPQEQLCIISLGRKRLWQKDSRGVLGKKKWGFILVQQSITGLLPKPFHVTVTLGRTKRVAGRKKMINRSWKAKLDMSQARTGRNRTNKGQNRINQLNKQAELWKKLLSFLFLNVFWKTRAQPSNSETGGLKDEWPKGFYNNLCSSFDFSSGHLLGT